MFDAGKLSDFKIAQDLCLSEFSGAPFTNLRASAVETFSKLSRPFHIITMALGIKTPSSTLGSTSSTRQPDMIRIPETLD